MKDFYEMSKIAQEVAEEIDKQLDDCKDLAKEGMLSEEMRGCAIRTTVGILDNWSVKLTSSVRNQILDWFQAEYGICL